MNETDAELGPDPTDRGPVITGEERAIELADAHLAVGWEPVSVDGEHTVHRSTGAVEHSYLRERRDGAWLFSPHNSFYVLMHPHEWRHYPFLIVRDTGGVITVSYERGREGALEVCSRIEELAAWGRAVDGG